jgi:hypothetical protein
MTAPDPASNPTRAIVYVSAEGLPDAWVANEKEVEVRVTQPDSVVEAVIVVPLAEARSWAADVYAAVTIAYREHSGDPHALSDYELANLPDPGRVVFESLAGRWHEPDPEVLRLRAELGLDDGANGSSSLGSSG